MSLEQQLRETMRRVADGLRPDAARAYDRFLRRRRRRMILMPAVAAAVIVATVMTMVAVAQRLPDPADPVQPAPTPTPVRPSPTPDRDLTHQPPEYLPGPRTFEVPAAGFSIEVPEGWEVADLIDREPFALEGHVAHLRLESEPLVDIKVTTEMVVPEFGPGKGEVYPATTDANGVIVPEGPYSFSRRPDGRRVLEAGQGSATAFYITWPYYCAPDVECRASTKLRTLEIQPDVTGASRPDAVWPDVQAVAEAIVRDARPITNALPGGDTTVKRDHCRALLSPPLPSPPAPSTGPDKVILEVSWTNSRMSACRGGVVSLALTSNGQPAPLEGGDQALTLDGVLPEGGADPRGHFAARLRWTNWCGAPTVRMWVDMDGEAMVAQQFERPASGSGDTGNAPPPCIDRSRPSKVEVVATAP